jgi:hypothetical protein
MKPLILALNLKSAAPHRTSHFLSIVLTSESHRTFHKKKLFHKAKSTNLGSKAGLTVNAVAEDEDSCAAAAEDGTPPPVVVLNSHLQGAPTRSHQQMPNPPSKIRMVAEHSQTKLRKLTLPSLPVMWRHKPHDAASHNQSIDG